MERAAPLPGRLLREDLAVHPDPAPRLHSPPRFAASGSRPHVDIDDALNQVPAPHADPAQHNIDSSLLRALDAALRLLPARQRSAWILKEIEDLSYAEIATVLAVTPIRYGAPRTSPSLPGPQHEGVAVSDFRH